jgi:hypothetical protein
MISCLLIQVTRNQQGLPVRKESVVSGESLQIGRGPACKIHLPDHRVYLHHATIKRSEDGTLYIEGEKDVVLNIDGTIEQSAGLSAGTRVEIGPYELVAGEGGAGHDIALSVEMIQAQIEPVSVPPASLTLTSLGLSKRKLGFGLAALVLFFFLLLPLLPSASVALDKWQADLPVTLTGAWDAGPLSGGHSIFGAKCSTCHKRPFQAVSNEACSGCHKNVVNHLANDDLHASAFKDVRCTDCHLDHKGKAGLVVHDASSCVTCHGDIKDRNPRTTLADIHDLSNHPSFRLSLWDGKNAARVRQGDKEQLVEKPGLKYSHKVHLDKEGVSSPGGNTVMVCTDCHKTDESGRHFEPMSMKKTCQQSGCHELYFGEPVEGDVPHGSVRVTLDRIREFYAKWLVDSPANMAECKSGGGNSARRVLDCASDLARENAGASLFRDNLDCGECHEIEQSGDAEVPWKIVPLHLKHDWQPGAMFPHSRHDTMNCTECHDKMNSKTSADVSMPTIEKCRECHAGNREVAGKIRSSCDSCHQFHQGVKQASK